MTWLPQWTSRAQSSEAEAPGPGVQRLAARAVYGVLLYAVSQVALTHLPYFKDDPAGQAWRVFLPALVFIAALLSLPAAAFLATLFIVWVLLYSSPAYALWFALFMVVLSGIYDDRLEHALLLAATPVLVFFSNLGFLPVLLVGVLFRARGGLVNGAGCLAAIAVGAALGLESLGDVILTGVAPGQGLAISGRLDLPRGLLDVGWVAGLTWEGFATELARLAGRWADTFTRSPVGVAQVVLWGLAAIVVHQVSAAARWGLEALPGLVWARGLVARGLGVLAGGLLLLAGYRVLTAVFLGVAAPGGHGQAVWVQILWSSAVALGVVVAVELVWLKQVPLGQMVARLRATWRRAIGPQPRSESTPPE